MDNAMSDVRQRLMDEIVALDLAQADWENKVTAATLEMACIKVEGQYILERRRELLRRLKQLDTMRSLRPMKGE
jgi:hypothetical protein